MKKLIVFLLLLNFIATMSVGYIIYDGDEIYDNCPECQLEHPEIVEDEKNNITSNKGAKEWNL